MEAEVVRECPRCGRSPLRLRWGLAARPVGSFSLSGAQLKFSASTRAILWCTHCPFQAEGSLIDERIEDGRFTGGHFVADPG